MGNPVWLKIAAVSDARDDDVVGVAAEGHEYAVYKVGGELFVTDNECTHAEARLSEGFVIDYCIECPMHQGQFDIRTGAPLCEPVTEPIRSYPVRIDGDQLLIDVS